MAKIGVTTTVPVEIIFAAGHTPVDLNNIFITNERPQDLVEEAEIAGYPRNLCGWIKGLYGTVLQDSSIETIIAVTQGDCSNTHALMETLELKGIKTIPFAFPFDRDEDMLRLQMEKLMERLKVEWDQVYVVKQELDEIRKLVVELDRLTWEENLVSGFENHLWQVSCSDFNGNPRAFRDELTTFLQDAREREPIKSQVRLGYMGVPPIFNNMYQYLEDQGARIVFNEVQRQFSMPYLEKDIIEQYRRYTYPYNIFLRIEDIREQIAQRKLDGLIHYTQSFCFRQIEDIIVREKLDIPILTLEGDKPGQLDARSKMRLDSFVEMIK